MFSCSVSDSCRCRSIIATIAAVGPAVFYFAAGTVAIHGLVIFGVGRLLKIDAGTLAVAADLSPNVSSSSTLLQCFPTHFQTIL